MRISLRWIGLMTILLVFGNAQAQTFSDSSNVYSMTWPRTGGPVGVADMDGDGYDDIIILDAGDNLYIDYQESDGSFTLHSYGSVSNSNQWGMTVGDIENDGHKDLISGGNGDGVHYVEIDSRGVYTSTDLPNPLQFMQGCNMVDVNNDGWLEFFGLDDVNKNRLWINDGAGSLSYDNDNLIDWDLFGSAALNRGNYGSTWTDFDLDGDIDLYIAKCCGCTTDLYHETVINQLWENDGSGNYTENASTIGLVLNEQSWTADFADIDNDGDFDCVVTNHTGTTELFENNGSGNFTDITAGSGLAVSGFILQSVFEDFDNDGFVDLLISGGAGTDRLYHNDGDKTFTVLSNPFPYPNASETGHSFGLGDLNHDGFIDVYMGFGNGHISPEPPMIDPDSDADALFMNDGNSNHFLSVELEGVISNRDAVGALMRCYGPWGTMLREVRAGESYGIVTSFTQTFGLGSNTTVDSLVITWPSGTEDRFCNLPADQFLKVTEGETVMTRLSVKIFLEGPYDDVSGLMSDDLRGATFLPTNEPFTGLGFTHVNGGGETVGLGVFDVTGNDAIVDWVFLELRDKNSNATVLDTRSALLQRDGDVVDMDGICSVAFSVAADDYFVTVRHRNHLGVMANSAVALSKTATSMDFSDGSVTTWGTDAQKDILGTMCLWMGNAFYDDKIIYTGGNNDRDKILVNIGGSVPTATNTGYHNEDCNLDGEVKYTGLANDRDPILVNIGGAVPTNSKEEQLP